jgi:outer membrane biosynthesis protein TonB
MLFAAQLLIATCAVGVSVTTAAAQKSSEPQLVVEVKPDYTPEARAAGIEGGVLLSAEVLADGNVGEVRVFDPSTPRTASTTRP